MNSSRIQVKYVIHMEEVREECMTADGRLLEKKDMKTKKEREDRETDVMAYPEWSWPIVIHRIACLD